MKLYLLTQSTETGKDGSYNGTWPSDLSLVTVTFVGTAKAGTKAGVVCASFNAG